VFGEVCIAAFLMFQRFIYVTASIIFARLGDPKTYGDLAAMENAVRVVTNTTA